MHGLEYSRRPAELTRRGQPFALATVVWRQGPSSGQQGARAIITESGDLHGWIGGACAEPVVIREAREVIAEGVPRLLLLGAPEQFGGRAEAMPEGMTLVPISCQSEGALEVYIEPVLPAPHLVIVGRSPMARTLADLAQALGWRTALRDAAEFAAADADEASMVVVATQGHGDEEAVEQAVAAQPGLPGPGRVGQARRGGARLPGRPGRAAGPAGPGARARRAGPRAHHAPGDRGGHPGRAGPAARVREAEGRCWTGSGPSLARGGAPKACPRRARSSGGSGGSPPARQRPGLRDDRDRRAGRFPLEHDGVTYYFCSAGCRQSFERDPRCLPDHEDGDPMLITNDFEVAQPVDKVWAFFQNIPQVAACLPGAELTEDLGDDKYQGRVAVRMGPVRLNFGGTAQITERDEAAKRLVVHATGAEAKGRGQASMDVTATLARTGRGTKVAVAQDLQLSGAAAQYGRGMISDVTSVLMRDFSARMQDRIERIERGESAEQVAAASATPAGGFTLGLRAALMALSRVFRRFFAPYQPTS